MKKIRARARKKATAARRPAKRRPSAALEAIAQEAEVGYNQSDGRVINRALGLLLHEQQACEEHLEGLRASIVEVQGKKRRVEARIVGLKRVIDKR